jgi:predicted enzyme related to lactoylglutathione lyase
MSRADPTPLSGSSAGMLLKRVIVFSPDAERLAAFYSSIFDLERLEQEGTGWVELDAGECSIAFHHVNEHAPVRDGWIKLVFGSADVTAEKARLESLGINMSEITTFNGIDLCDGLDPDGNRFQISSRGM